MRRDAVDLERVQRESKLLKSVRDVNGIVELYEYFATAEHYVIATRYLSGPDLLRPILDEEPLDDERTVASIVEATLRSLVALHARCVVHGDLRPEHIVYCDFPVSRRTALVGFAKSHRYRRYNNKDNDGSNNNDCEQEIFQMPSLMYRAPELIVRSGNRPNSNAFGPPSDIWALGCIAYVLLAGYAPFTDDGTTDVANSIVDDDPSFNDEEDDDECWGRVSADAIDFIQQALVKSPRHRPSAQRLLEHRWLTAAHQI